MSFQHLLGKPLPPLTYEVEKGQLRFFADVVGETDPIYFDEAAAQAAGYRSVLAPPTFGFSILRGAARQMPIVDALGWGDDELGRCLHGEQDFRFGAAICAGDTISIRESLQNVYEKQGGAMQFFVTQTRLHNQVGEDVGRMQMTLILQAAA